MNEFDGLLEGMVNDLMNKLRSIGSDSGKENIKIGELSDNEAEEWNSMRASCTVIEKKRKEIQMEEGYLQTRAELFWYKIRFAHKARDVNSVSIEVEAGKLFLIKNICKGVNCEGNCSECPK
jgi:hypothetical protein